MTNRIATAHAEHLMQMLISMPAIVVFLVGFAIANAK
jgi:hypothetical protein